MGLSRNHFQLKSGTSPVRSRPATHQCGQRTLCDLDWPVPMETDNRSRCGRSLVRSGLTSARKWPCQAFWWSGHPPATNVARNSRSFSPYWGSRNPSTVERRLVESVHLVLPGVKLLVRVRRVGGGDPQLSGYQPSGLAIPEHQPSGLAIAMVGRLRHGSDAICNAVSASMRGRPRRRRAGRRRQT
jgi:hypothetical protein